MRSPVPRQVSAYSNMRSYKQTERTYDIRKQEERLGPPILTFLFSFTKGLLTFTIET